MDDNKEKESYKQIFKATGVFGGVQFFSIIINLLKSKIVALFLGAEGMGLMSLFQNPISLVSQVSNLGLGSSAIRDVAQSNGDLIESQKTVKTVRVWTRVCGVIGMLFVIIFANIISKWTLGSDEYTLEFRILSTIVLLMALGEENAVILKGRRKIKFIAFAGVLSSLCGLVFSIPLYYFFGKDGIVAVLVLSALFVYGFHFYYVRKERIANINMSPSEIWHQGKGMATLGIMMVLANIIQTAVMYLTNLFIRKNGGVADVGLFQAALYITNTSIGLVYTAMAGDFYPRLSAIISNREESNNLVNQQAEVATLISTPILLGMITFVQILIYIFLSSEFYSVTVLVQWLLLSAVLRASTWTIHYVVLANGDTKLFFLLTLMTNFILLITYPVGYHLFGLQGLGIGYLLMTCINAVVMYLVVHQKYGISYNKPFKVFFIISISSTILAFLSMRFLPKTITYVINSIVIIAISAYYFKEIDKKMSIISSLKNRIKTKK